MVFYISAHAHSCRGSSGGPDSQAWLGTWPEGVYTRLRIHSCLSAREGNDLHWVLRFTRWWLLAAVIVSTLGAPTHLQAATSAIYTDSLASAWADWSWTSVNLAAGPPVHSGSHSIAVTYTGGWQGFSIHHPGIDTTGYDTLRFFVHGGSSGNQHYQIYATHATSSGDVDSAAVALPSPTAGAWTEVRLALSDLGASGVVLTRLSWQDTSGGAQPTLYIDDIALVSDESPDGPTLSSGHISPGAVRAGSSTPVTVRVAVTDPQGPGDITAVALDAAALGRGTVPLSLDATGRYAATFTVAPTATVGENTLWITARDAADHHNSLALGAFVTLGAPGGSIPSGLPSRLGWGTNQWDETPGQDWQVNSGVPWDYVYQYITWGWQSWGGQFVHRFVTQAWAKGYTPLISVYLMLDTPPACGESSTCYAQKLQNASAVSAYLASLQEAAAEASGTQPVIFQLEPDFYGYMQQLSNDPYNRPPGVQPDDPTSYPVALNVSGYPNTLAGFGRRMVDVVHSAAANALVAPHASMWAVNGDPQSVTGAEAVHMAQRTAAFIDAMGGAQANALTVEWSDRDAGSGLRPWWDDTNQTLPRPSRAILWENALSTAARQRLILWQMPCGNMGLDNTPDHYRDNRAAYAFAHAADLAAAGVFAVMFGSGADPMTTPATDGGFIRLQAGLYCDVIHLSPRSYLPFVTRRY
jgi:hypothetical protein